MNHSTNYLQHNHFICHQSYPLHKQVALWQSPESWISFDRCVTLWSDFHWWPGPGPEWWAACGPGGPGGRWGHQSNSDTRARNITTLHITAQYRMIVQDISDLTGTEEHTMIVTGEFLTKMNYLLVLMGVIFTLLCLLLTVCVIMWV